MDTIQKRMQFVCGGVEEKDRLSNKRGQVKLNPYRKGDNQKKKEKIEMLKMGSSNRHGGKKKKRYIK